jgi:predicted PurR-regulated permease PerM
MPSPDRDFYSRVFGLATLSLLGVALFWMLRPFLAPLFWAGLLAMLVFPANLALRRGLRGRNGMAALLLTAAVVLIVVLPAVIGVSLVVTQATDLVVRLQTMAKAYHVAAPGDVLALPAVNDAIHWVSERVPVTAEQAQDWLVQGGQRALEFLLAITGSLFTGVLGAFANIVLGLFLFFFFLRDGERMIARTIGLIPLEDPRKAQLVGHLYDVTTAVVLSSLVTAFVQGTLVGVGFTIAGLAAPAVFGALAMIASLLPLVGAAVVWVPAALILAARHDWGWAIFLTAWCVGLVHSSDNVIRPLFISSRAKISTLPVFVGLIGGVSAFGATGMFLGPVLVALGLALVDFWEEVRAGGEAPAPQAPPTEPA